MNLREIVAELDAEIRRLELIRALLTGHAAPLKRGVFDVVEDQYSQIPMVVDGGSEQVAVEGIFR